MMINQLEMYDYRFKLAIIGDDRVGKAALLSRFVYGFFTQVQRLTMSTDIFTKAIDIQGKKVKLELWNFRRMSLFSSYLKGVDGVIYVYDITNEDSLINLYYIWDVVRNVEETIPIFLIGNKIDLREKHKIPREKGLEIAEEIGARVFVETSAKTGINVQSVFEVITDLLINEEPLKQKPVKLTDQLKEKIEIAKKQMEERRVRKKSIKAQKDFKKKIEDSSHFKEQKIELKTKQSKGIRKVQPKESLIEKYQRELREGKSVPSDYWKAAEIPKYEINILEGLKSQYNFSIYLVKDVNDEKRGHFLNECSFSIRNNAINGLCFYHCVFTALPESIYALSSLKSLRIMKTNLESLPEKIGDFSSLEKLYISECLLILLPDSIGNLSSLKSLFISSPLIRLPSSIGNLSSLRELILFGTKLASLPDSIGKLSSLAKLRLNGPIKHLPESISKLQNLNKLEIFEHRLLQIPESIGKLSSLKKMFFSLSLYGKSAQISDSLRKKLESRGIEFQY